MRRITQDGGREHREGPNRLVGRVRGKEKSGHKLRGELKSDTDWGWDGWMAHLFEASVYTH